MLEELREKISVFDSCDLLAKVAALDLLPENASRRTSLDALSHLSAAVRYDPNAPKISRPRLEKLLQNHLSASSEPGIADDPFPELFTEEITFINGPFIVLPGTLAGSYDILNWLLKAAVLKTPNLGFERFREEVTRSAILCLSVSNAIARKAGLRRGMSPALGNTSDILVPNAKSLDELVKAVTFSQSELVLLGTGKGSLGQTIDPLSIDIGEVDWDGYLFEHGELHHKPFVRIGDKYVVSNPSGLMAALIHRIFNLAYQYGNIGALADAYRMVIWSEIEELLRFSGSYKSSAPLPYPEPTTFLEGLFALDADKVIYVQLATDDRADFVGQHEPAQWDVNELQLQLGQRLEEVVKHLKKAGVPTDRILTLTLLESTGRLLVGRLPNPTFDNLQLMIPVISFKTMSLADGRNPLWLWKFASAWEEIRKKTEILSFDILDEYDIYRKRQTYYLSDEALPDLIQIAPGAGLSVRESISKRFDPHGVPAYESGYLMQVWSAFGRNVPICFPSKIYGNQPALVIEGSLPFPIWVTSPEQEEHSIRSLQVLLVDMVAYWIWQFESIIATSLAELAHIHNIFRIELEFENPALWLESIETTKPMDASPCTVISGFERIKNGIQISLSSSFLKLAQRADNQGERQFIREFLSGLGAFLRESYSVAAESLEMSNLDEVIEELAPLGPKKKLVLLDSDPILYEGFERLPEFRPVQEAEIQELLDYVGEHCSGMFPDSKTLTEKADRNSVVKEAVECLYGDLRRLVRTFDSKELLCLLLAYNESNILERAQLEITYPTRLACFDNEVEVLENISKEMHANDIASLANRFLVEYASAQQPSGSETLSLETYDRLLALASEICNLGMHSEFTYFDLIDMDLSILPSKRLGFDKEAHESARKSFMSKLTVSRVASSQKAFASHWIEPTAQRQGDNHHPSPESVALDEAFASETGLSLTELVMVLIDIYNLGTKQASAVKELPREELMSSLCQTLKWSVDKITFALDLLSLESREDFLKPIGASSHEVYPWRFNRSWSFLRRPLVSLGNESERKILWGNRHLMSAIQYVTDLSSSGRLRATSDPLRRIMGDIRQQKATEFEDSVGRLVSGVTGETAKVRVRKVGGKKIMKSGLDLGDVDVLGIIQSARIVLCIECKALVLARTPYEVGQQLKELFEGEEGRASTVQKHLRRVEWVEENIDLVLSECFGISGKGKWKVRPVLLSDSDLYASYLRDNPFPVWSVEDLNNMRLQDIVACFKT